jgi:hypothetical protein
LPDDDVLSNYDHVRLPDSIFQLVNHLVLTIFDHLRSPFRLCRLPFRHCRSKNACFSRVYADAIPKKAPYYQCQPLCRP